jgi:hypothetical protein
VREQDWNSNAWESSRIKYTTFGTRRIFEIKNERPEFKELVIFISKKPKQISP